MAKRGKGHWSENDFENWFCKSQQLPDVGPVLVIARQKPRRRVIDLVALDADGGLVILEIKNEAATRTAIGQSLEYLAQYANLAVDDLDDEYRAYIGKEASLRNDFQACFGRELNTIAERRRVCLVAPHFHPAASIGASYLNDKFQGSGISYHLFEARLVRKGEFELAVYLPAIRPPMELHGFVTKANGRLFYVLEPGPAPIVWSIGRRTEAGELKRAASNRQGDRALRVATESMILETEGGPELDLSQTGTTWVRKKKPQIQAKVVGAIKLRGTVRIVAARFVDGACQRFFQLEPKTFHRRFERREVELPDWKHILASGGCRGTTKGG